MASELIFQRKVIEACRELGGRGIKMSNRFMAGVPDLLLLYEGRTYLVEVKLVVMPVKQDDLVKISQSPLTPLQTKFLLEWQEAGACAGLMLCCQTPTEDLVLCTRNILRHSMPTREQYELCSHRRARGQRLRVLMAQGLMHPLIS